MRIVVTGALGHIGSRLIREIPKVYPGAKVVMIDNLMTQRYCSLFSLPPGVDYEFIEGDILTADLDSLFKDAHVVVHLAAITDAAASFGKLDQIEATNYQGTELVARACSKNGVRLIFLSTTSVYGSQAEVVDETCQELDPQSPYADSKLRSELLLAELSRTSELKHITLRFGTIFGTSAGMRFHTAVNKFIWQAALGQPVTVWTTALDQRRPYLELGDAIRALCFVISNELFDGLTYNIVTFNATVRELLDTITAFVPDLEIKFVDTKIMNQLSYTVLSDKFCRRGFEFRGNLLSGVSESLGLLYQLRQAVRNSFEAKHAVEELRKLALPNWINVESEKPSTEERL